MREVLEPGGEPRPGVLCHEAGFEDGGEYKLCRGFWENLRRLKLNG